MQTLSLAETLQKKFIGTDELRKGLTRILNKLSDKGGEIVVTQHGTPQAILLDLDSYLELHDQIADYNPKLVMRVNSALVDAKKGNVVDSDEVFKSLSL